MIYKSDKSDKTDKHFEALNNKLSSMGKDIKQIKESQQFISKQYDDLLAEFKKVKMEQPKRHRKVGTRLYQPWALYCMSIGFQHCVNTGSVVREKCDTTL